ncbi:MAG TPA: YbaB/EbfC family nucleoid-associated protein [Propionibacteriaceae bacterium]|nr:YbaB/EbfC family nucleoid-associated protein [Propionibacteriaceae bacterium]HPZ49476.1 YbaB/EbfC family nucleoid-associated protein [Propionibacteriaceae bacterium]HQE31785.1 YbaB/EbfC family nucleoid-associated protein [Propionibacteriaceae bacterium]
MTAEFNDLFGRLSAQTQRIADGDIPVPDLETTPVEVEGYDEDQLIGVRMTNGKVTSVDVQPQALRGNHVLGDLIKDAVNAAIDAHMATVMAQLTEEQADFAKLTKELQSIQTDSLKAMDNFTDGMMQSLQQAVRLSQ